MKKFVSICESQYYQHTDRSIGIPRASAEDFEETLHVLDESAGIAHGTAAD